VLVSVETVVLTWVLVMLPDVIVLVTGQVVSYVVTSTVVYTATVVPGTVGEEEAPVGEFSVVEGVLTESVAGVDALLAGTEGVGVLTTGVVEEFCGTELDGME